MSREPFARTRPRPPALNPFAVLDSNEFNSFVDGLRGSIRDALHPLRPVRPLPRTPVRQDKTTRAEGDVFGALDTVGRWDAQSSGAATDPVTSTGGAMHGVEEQLDVSSSKGSPQRIPTLEVGSDESSGEEQEDDDASVEMADRPESIHYDCCQSPSPELSRSRSTSPARPVAHSSGPLFHPDSRNDSDDGYRVLSVHDAPARLDNSEWDREASPFEVELSSDVEVLDDTIEASSELEGYDRDGSNDESDGARSLERQLWSGSNEPRTRSREDSLEVLRQDGVASKHRYTERGSSQILQEPTEKTGGAWLGEMLQTHSLAGSPSSSIASRHDSPTPAPLLFRPRADSPLPSSQWYEPASDLERVASPANGFIHSEESADETESMIEAPRIPYYLKGKGRAGSSSSSTSDRPASLQGLQHSSSTLSSDEEGPASSTDSITSSSLLNHPRSSLETLVRNLKATLHDAESKAVDGEQGVEEAASELVFLRRQLLRVEETLARRRGEGVRVPSGDEPEIHESARGSESDVLERQGSRDEEEEDDDDEASTPTSTLEVETVDLEAVRILGSLPAFDAFAGTVDREDEEDWASEGDPWDDFVANSGYQATHIQQGPTDDDSDAIVVDLDDPEVASGVVEMEDRVSSDDAATPRASDNDAMDVFESDQTVTDSQVITLDDDDEDLAAPYSTYRPPSPESTPLVEQLERIFDFAIDDQEPVLSREATRDFEALKALLNVGVLDRVDAGVTERPTTPPCLSTPTLPLPATFQDAFHPFPLPATLNTNLPPDSLEQIDLDKQVQALLEQLEPSTIPSMELGGLMSTAEPEMWMEDGNELEILEDILDDSPRLSPSPEPALSIQPLIEFIECISTVEVGEEMEPREDVAIEATTLDNSPQLSPSPELALPVEPSSELVEDMVAAVEPEEEEMDVREEATVEEVILVDSSRLSPPPVSPRASPPPIDGVLQSLDTADVAQDAGNDVDVDLDMLDQLPSPHLACAPESLADATVDVSSLVIIPADKPSPSPFITIPIVSSDDTFVRVLDEPDETVPSSEEEDTVLAPSLRATNEAPGDLAKEDQEGPTIPLASPPSMPLSPTPSSSPRMELHSVDTVLEPTLEEPTEVPEDRPNRDQEPPPTIPLDPPALLPLSPALLSSVPLQQHDELVGAALSDSDDELTLIPAAPISPPRPQRHSARLTPAVSSSRTSKPAATPTTPTPRVTSRVVKPLRQSARILRETTPVRSIRVLRDRSVDIPPSPESRSGLRKRARSVDIAPSVSTDSPRRHIHHHGPPSLYSRTSPSNTSGHLPVTRSHCEFTRLRITSHSNVHSHPYTFIIPSCSLTSPIAQEVMAQDHISNLGPPNARELRDVIHLDGEEVVDDAVQDADVAIALRRITGGNWNDGHCDMLYRARNAGRVTRSSPAKRSWEEQGGSQDGDGEGEQGRPKRRAG